MLAHLCLLVYCTKSKTIIFTALVLKDFLQLSLKTTKNFTLYLYEKYIIKSIKKGNKSKHLSQINHLLNGQ